jgi:hypothetical protein
LRPQFYIYPARPIIKYGSRCMRSFAVEDREEFIGFVMPEDELDG